jgi:hypothetical protein
MEIQIIFQWYSVTLYEELSTSARTFKCAIFQPMNDLFLKLKG